MRNQADCFVSPSGRVVKLVNGTHISTVIANPEGFGFTREEIIDIHKKHNEQLGSEGNARDEIIVALIKDGWLRVNYEVRMDAFLIDANADSGDFRNQLAEFCMGAVVGELDGKERRYSDIRVFYREVLSKIHSFEDFNYILKIIKSLVTNYSY